MTHLIMKNMQGVLLCQAVTGLDQPNVQYLYQTYRSTTEGQNVLPRNISSKPNKCTYQIKPMANTFLNALILNNL